jgi:LacI family transcriptional regulator
MRTPISSVDRNLEILGYRGAELLDRMIQGERPPKTPIRVPPAGLITRKSSDIMAINHRGVARSLRFIMEHYHEPIGVEDLMKVAAMSRSGLYQAFLEHVGHAPGNELQRVRIDRARKLLVESRDKLEVVAEKCGYQSANTFWFAFRQATGMSPREYRRKFAL